MIYIGQLGMYCHNFFTFSQNHVTFYECQSGDILAEMKKNYLDKGD